MKQKTNKMYLVEKKSIEGMERFAFRSKGVAEIVKKCFEAERYEASIYNIEFIGTDCKEEIEPFVLANQQERVHCFMLQIGEAEYNFDVEMKQTLDEYGDGDTFVDRFESSTYTNKDGKEFEVNLSKEDKDFLDGFASHYSRIKQTLSFELEGRFFLDHNDEL